MIKIFAGVVTAGILALGAVAALQPTRSAEAVLAYAPSTIQRLVVPANCSVTGAVACYASVSDTPCINYNCPLAGNIQPINMGGIICCQVLVSDGTGSTSAPAPSGLKGKRGGRLIPSCH